MSSHNICFHGEVSNIFLFFFFFFFLFFSRKSHLLWSCINCITILGTR